MTDSVPERYVQTHLVDPTHRLPMPNSQRFFSAADEGELVDRFDLFWIGLLADGSIALGPRPAAPEPEPAPAPAA